MSSSMGRIGAILIKEMQDIRSNVNVLAMYVLPVMLTALYDNFIPGMPNGFALGFGSLFLVIMVGMYVPSMIIAEEKEKRTLEVLMLSPAKPIEIFVGKGLLTFLSMMVTFVILLLVTGNAGKHLDVLLVGTAVAAVFSILLGMVVGLLAQNQMNTGIIGMPVYLILMLVPLLAGIGVDIMRNIAQVLPTYHYFEMMRMAFEEQKGLVDMLPQLGILAGSIVVVLIVLLLTYRRKGFQ